MTGEVTSEGKRLIDNRQRCAVEASRRQEWADSAKRDFESSAHSLARWLMPDDARPGEKFCVWYGDSIVQVEVGGLTQTGGIFVCKRTMVTVRTPGRMR